MSPVMKKVENAGHKAISSQRKPYKITSDDFFHDVDNLKFAFNELINGESRERIAVIPSVSYGLANVVTNLSKQGEIIVTEGQFPSNVYPWMKLKQKGFKVKMIEAPRSVHRGEEWNQRILESINKKTTLVAIGNVHWADGTRFDLATIRKRLDDVDGLLIIDGTQSIGALEYNQSEIRADAVICAGYKWLMGPYGIGLAYYGERFDNGEPIEEHWINRKNSHEFSKLVNYEEEYRQGASRYSVGEHSNFILVAMLLAGIKQVRRWSPYRIQEYCKNLTEDLFEIAEKIGFKSEHHNYRSSHLFGLDIPEGIDKDKMMQVFHERKVSVSLRGDTIRVSPHVYNDKKDINKFLECFGSSKKLGLFSLFFSVINEK